MNNTSLALSPQELDTLIFLASKLRTSLSEAKPRTFDGLPESDVLSVGCGWCGAAPGTACKKKQTGRGGLEVGAPVKKPHDRRIRRASEVLARRASMEVVT